MIEKMNLNLWECAAEGCQHTCVGIGGAVGLRAIGWFYEKGPRVFCPNHHPQKTQYELKQEVEGLQFLVKKLS